MRISVYRFFIRVIPFLIITQINAQYSNITIAVLDFNSNTGDKRTDAMLSTGTSATIVTDLSSVKGIVVVERSKLNTLNTEIALGELGIVDESTAQKAGKMTGANFVVIGNWQKFGPSYRVNARLVKVETGMVELSAKSTGTDVFAVQDDIIFKILNKLQITPQIAEKQIIRKRETSSTAAYAEYSLGLRANDRGNKSEMKVHMEKAVSIDPTYSTPKDYLKMRYLDVEKKRYKRRTGKDLTLINAILTLISSSTFVSAVTVFPVTWAITKDGESALVTAAYSIMPIMVLAVWGNTWEVTATTEGEPLTDVLEKILREKLKKYRANANAGYFPVDRKERFILYLVHQKGTPLGNSGEIVYKVTYRYVVRSGVDNYSYLSREYKLKKVNGKWEAYPYKPIYSK